MSGYVTSLTNSMTMDDAAQLYDALHEAFGTGWRIGTSVTRAGVKQMHARAPQA